MRPCRKSWTDDGGPSRRRARVAERLRRASHTAGKKGQAPQGGKKALGRRLRGRGKKREPGRGHDDKDWPAIIAWVSRQGSVVVQGVKDFTVKTVQKAAD